MYIYDVYIFPKTCTEKRQRATFTKASYATSAFSLLKLTPNTLSALITTPCSLYQLTHRTEIWRVCEERDHGREEKGRKCNEQRNGSKWQFPSHRSPLRRGARPTHSNMSCWFFWKIEPMCWKMSGLKRYTPQLMMSLTNVLGFST